MAKRLSRFRNTIEGERIHVVEFLYFGDGSIYGQKFYYEKRFRFYPYVQSLHQDNGMWGTKAEILVQQSGGFYMGRRSESRANLPGGMWKIESAYIADGGRLPDGSVAEGTLIPVTFDSSIIRTVMPSETFWSDAAGSRFRRSIIWHFRGRLQHWLRAIAFLTIRKSVGICLRCARACRRPISADGFRNPKISGFAGLHRLRTRGRKAPYLLGRFHHPGCTNATGRL